VRHLLVGSCRVRTHGHNLAVLVLQIATSAHQSWLSQNSTLVVGVVGIVVSGFLGPTITALWTGRRDRQADHRALVVARRVDLRVLIDEAAKVLGGAVANLRPLLLAEQNEEAPPKAPADFLGTLAPLGQRLRLYLPDDHLVIGSYEAARARLLALSKATRSQAVFDAAVQDFEAARAKFLDDGRVALQAPVLKGKEI
jgi:hypothetical protein